MSTADCKKRRRQYAHGFGDLPPLRRPHYARTSVDKQKRKLAQLLEKTKAMQARGK